MLIDKLSSLNYKPQCQLEIKMESFLEPTPLKSAVTLLSGVGSNLSNEVTSYYLHTSNFIRNKTIYSFNFFLSHLNKTGVWAKFTTAHKQLRINVFGKYVDCQHELQQK